MSEQRTPEAPTPGLRERILSGLRDGAGRHDYDWNAALAWAVEQIDKRGASASRVAESALNKGKAGLETADALSASPADRDEFWEQRRESAPPGCAKEEPCPSSKPSPSIYSSEPSADLSSASSTTEPATPNACPASTTGKHEARLTSSGREYCEHCDADLPIDKWRCSECGGYGPSVAKIRHGEHCSERPKLATGLTPSLAVRVEDLSGGGGGPFKLFVGDWGVAVWPCNHEPHEYAEEVARVLRLALGASPSSSPAGFPDALDADGLKAPWNFRMNAWKACEQAGKRSWFNVLEYLSALGNIARAELRSDLNDPEADR